MDGPLPECISTEEKQEKLAGDLVASHFHQRPTSIKLASVQGTSSITFEVILEDGTSQIIQLRTEPLDITPIITARQLLGSSAPNIEPISDPKLASESVFAFCMDRMPGNSWLEIEGSWKPDALLECSTSLGRLLSHCFVSRDEGAIATYIQPTLRKILMMPNRSEVDVSSYFPLVEELITASPQLNELPGFFSHLDLNPMNVFVEDTGIVRGIIDWEESRTLPFGICGWGIHFLAGEFLTVDTGEIEFTERPIYEEMETRFWKALLENASSEAKMELEGKMSLVQLAVITGTILRVLGIYTVNGIETQYNHFISTIRANKIVPVFVFAFLYSFRNSTR
ncbi:unnamed protein product [Penicillium egyptiacum]|uniref:Aminoglycoside phosphotransferase domain-containing protein n=1 Tax=Penicillium egyptiacum TaxID=1303716 RepID=A0A9W4KBC9_9EURO|nr:unnamed protein product [Penicillium egyptiacum]